VNENSSLSDENKRVSVEFDFSLFEKKTLQTLIRSVQFGTVTSDETTGLLGRAHGV
jgi:hypothetical protein